MEYLERYFTLIAFAAYVHHPSFDGAAFNAEDGSFQAWLDKRPELHSILRRLLWRNPMGALMPPTLPGTVVALPTPDVGEAADAVVSGRAGGVLGAHCILKEEPYPGVQTSRIPVFHDGAPNFRQVLCLALQRTGTSQLTPLSACILAGHVVSGVRCRNLYAGRHSCRACCGWRSHSQRRPRAVVQHARGAMHLHRRAPVRAPRGYAPAGKPVRVCVPPSTPQRLCIL